MVSRVQGRKPWLAAGLVVVLGISRRASLTLGQTRSAQGSEPKLILAIRVCSKAGVPRGTLGEAKKEAARILRAAEVETTWLECLPAGVDPQTQQGPSQGTGADFSLRILDGIPPGLSFVRSGTLGFALPCSEQQPSCPAYVFYKRVEEQVWHGDASASQVLGHAMAHEIGHLLLGPAHAPAGIMGAKWDRADLHRAAWEKLNFSPQQSELIRARVLARQKAAKCSAS